MAEFEVEVRKNNCNFARPFHNAFQAKRLICPELEKIGLGQHYWVIHKKEATDVVMKLACQTMEQFYGQWRSQPDNLVALCKFQIIYNYWTRLSKIS